MIESQYIKLYALRRNNYFISIFFLAFFPLKLAAVLSDYMMTQAPAPLPSFLCSSYNVLQSLRIATS